MASLLVADCPIMSCPLPQSTVFAGCICTHFRAACRWLDDLTPLFVANVKSACTIGWLGQSSPVLCWVARHHRSRFSHTHQKSHLSTDDWSPLPFCGRYTVHPQQCSRVWLVSVGWQTQRKKNRLDCSKLARYPPAVLPLVSPLYEQRRRHVRIQDLKYGKLVDKSVC